MVQDHIGHGRPHGVRQSLPLDDIDDDRLHARGPQPLGTSHAAGQPGHPVTPREKQRDDPPPDHAGRSSHEYMHQDLLRPLIPGSADVDAASSPVGGAAPRPRPARHDGGGGASPGCAGPARCPPRAVPRGRRRPIRPRRAGRGTWAACRGGGAPRPSAIAGSQSRMGVGSSSTMFRTPGPSGPARRARRSPRPRRGRRRTPTPRPRPGAPYPRARRRRTTRRGEHRAGPVEVAEPQDGAAGLGRRRLELVQRRDRRTRTAAGGRRQQGRVLVGRARRRAGRRTPAPGDDPAYPASRAASSRLRVPSVRSRLVSANWAVIAAVAARPGSR